MIIKYAAVYCSNARYKIYVNFYKLFSQYSCLTLIMAPFTVITKEVQI